MSNIAKSRGSQNLTGAAALRYRISAMLVDFPATDIAQWQSNSVCPQTLSPRFWTGAECWPGLHLLTQANVSVLNLSALRKLSAISCQRSANCDSWRMRAGVLGKAGSTPVPGVLNRYTRKALVKLCRQCLVRESEGEAKCRRPITTSSLRSTACP